MLRHANDRVLHLIPVHHEGNGHGGVAARVPEPGGLERSARRSSASDTDKVGVGDLQNSIYQSRTRSAEKEEKGSQKKGRKEKKREVKEKEGGKAEKERGCSKAIFEFQTFLH